MIPEFHPAAELELEAAAPAGEEIETGLGAELSAKPSGLLVFCVVCQGSVPLLAPVTGAFR